MTKSANDCVATAVIEAADPTVADRTVASSRGDQRWIVWPLSSEAFPDIVDARSFPENGAVSASYVENCVKG